MSINSEVEEGSNEDEKACNGNQWRECQKSNLDSPCDRRIFNRRSLDVFLYNDDFPCMLERTARVESGLEMSCISQYTPMMQSFSTKPAHCIGAGSLHSELN